MIYLAQGRQLLDPSIAGEKLGAGLNQLRREALPDSSLRDQAHLGPDYSAGLATSSTGKLTLNKGELTSAKCQWNSTVRQSCMNLSPLPRCELQEHFSVFSSPPSPPAPQESHKAFKQLNCFLNLSFLFWLMFYSHAFHVPRAVLLEFCGCCAWAEQRLYYFWAAMACLYLTTVKGLLRNAHTEPHVLGDLSPILCIRFFKTSTHSSQLSTKNLASSCN